MKKLFFALIVFILLCSHSMYLKLDTYFLKPDTSATIQLFNATFNKSENIITPDRMIDASFVGNGNRSKIDIDQWSEKDSVTILNFRTGESGTWVAGISTASRTAEMNAADFNNYLEHGGVLDMLEWRRKNDALRLDAVEKYSKHLKAIFQVGDKKTSDWQTTLGYLVEFVPQRNPYDLHTGDELQVKLLYNGEPLADQLVYADYEETSHGHSHDQEHKNTEEHSHDSGNIDETNQAHSHSEEHDKSTEHGHSHDQERDNAEKHGHSHDKDTTKETDQIHSHAEEHEHTEKYSHSHEMDNAHETNHAHSHSEEHARSTEHGHSHNQEHDNAEKHDHSHGKDTTKETDQIHSHAEEHEHTEKHSHSHEMDNAHETNQAHSHSEEHARSTEHGHSHTNENGKTEEEHQHSSGTQLRTDANGNLTVKLTADGIWHLRTMNLVHSEEPGFTHESNLATLAFEVLHGHDEATHSHDDKHEEGIPSYVYWVGSLILLLGLFLWFNRKR